MALIPGYSSSVSFNRFGRSLVLAVGESIGVRSVTLSADATFDAASGTILSLDGGASDRNVDAVASAEVAGMVKVIKNAGTTNVLTVRDAATTTVLATLAPGQWVGLFHTGAAWVAYNPSTVGAAHVKTSGTNVNDTTTETTIGSHTLPANTIKAGTKVRVRGSLRVIGVNATPTIVLKLKLGGTAYITSASLSVIANDQVVFDVVITGRAAPGASASVAIEGVTYATQSGTPAAVPKVIAPANYATNGALAVAATIQWSAAHASNQLTCDSFSVDVIG